jgi:outer membrane protein OmpA-like peptidoglycan-associated protein
MKQLLVIAILVFFCTKSEAQFGGLLKNVKNKVDNKINTKVDHILNGKSNSEATKGESNVQQAEKQPAQVVSYSKFDFIPGEKIIYAEDFGSDNLGELPLRWNSTRKGEVVTLENIPGRWLRLFPGTKYLSGSKQSYGVNYTVEFDLLMQGTPPSGTRFLPTLQFSLTSSGARNPLDNYFRNSTDEINSVELLARPNVDGGSFLNLQSVKQSRVSFSSNDMKNAKYSESLNKVAHYAMQVQGSRVRFWVNEQKIFDVPRVIAEGNLFNQLYFNVHNYHFYNEDNYGLYLSNIKIATGLPDARHKLLEEGKFSTNGILFDYQSGTIRPESGPVLKEIADVLTGAPMIKVKVIGHTSSDGDDKANLELSKKRAEAVKVYITSQFSIPADRIVIEGKGETQPVGDNKTKEGREQNRRVEFIKL